MSDQPLQSQQDDGHRVQLDALRAFAVIGVLVQHFVPVTEDWVRLGNIGVRVFFTLSGFLITGILLRVRFKIEDAADSNADARPGLWQALRSFYARRFLRIFPLFYLVLFATYLLGSFPVRETFGWHVTYLSNVFFFKHGQGYYSVGHFWTLAVEEQFYLLWPIVALFISRRMLFPVLIALTLTGPILRASLLAAGFNAWQAFILMPACLDTLGLGALLAAVWVCYPQQVFRFARVAMIVGLPMLLVCLIGTVLAPSKWWTVMFDLSVGLPAVWAIAHLYQGVGGVTGRVFSWRPLAYVGTISYGIYVMHNFVATPTTRLLEKLGWDGSALVRLTCMCAVTFALAIASWHLFERPINQLKRFFPYTRRRPHASPSSTPREAQQPHLQPTGISIDAQLVANPGS